MKKDVSKDKIVNRILIQMSYESLNNDGNIDLNHEKTLKLAVPVTYV